MKKNLLEKLSFFLLALTLYSCSKEKFNDKNRPLELSTQQVKEYYNSLKINKVFQLSESQIKVADLIAPKWDGAVKGIQKGYEYIEVPISMSKKEVSLYEMDPGRKQNAQIRAENSFSTLVFYRSSESDIQTAVLTYIPNDDFVANPSRPISQNRIGNMDSRFSGYVEYKDLDGKVKRIAKIVNGISVKAYDITPAPSSRSAKGRMMSAPAGPENVMNSSSCFPVCTPIFQTICAGPAGPGTGFDEDINCETTQIGENCHWVCSGGGDVPTPGGPGSGGGGTPTNPVDPYQNEKFDIDECEMVFEAMDMEFDEGEPLPEDYDPQQNQPKPKPTHRYVSPNGTIFTEWTDNSGRVHLHAQLGSYYKGYFNNFKNSLITIGTGISGVFDLFKEGKFVSPVSWGAFYGSQGEYIFGEMSEYYKDKKERNKKNGGSPCKK